MSMALGCLLLALALPLYQNVVGCRGSGGIFALERIGCRTFSLEPAWALMECAHHGSRAITVLLPFMLIPDLIGNRHQRMQAGMQLLMVLIVMLVVRTVLDQVTEILAWRGKSPSLTLQRLPALEYVSWLAAERQLQPQLSWRPLWRIDDCCQLPLIKKL
ncbi:MAG: hypothetical protein IPK95_06920 [Cellvibrionales bacterium]|nr:hypothetical protein [Cellvibrionales bacterium]